MSNKQIGSSEKAAPGLFYGYIIVAVSFLTLAVILGLHISFGVFFKPISDELNWSRAITSGAFALSNIMHGLLSIVTGWLNDRFGPRIVLTGCGLLSGIGYLLLSQIGEVWHFYLVFGVLIGAGSTIFVPLFSTIARWFVKRRSMMSGIAAAGIGLGMLIMPLLVNGLILAYNWRNSSMILGIIILVIVVSSAQFMKRDPGKVNQIAYGKDKSKETVINSGNAGITLGNAVSSWQFWVFLGVMFCSGFCSFALQIHIVPYITDTGISSTSAATILAIIGGTSIIGQLGLGSAADRLGNKLCFFIGLILLSIMIGGLLLTGTLWILYLFAIIFGIGIGGNMTQESPMVAWLFGLASHGSIFGILAVGFTFGGSLGPFITGYLFDTTGSYNLAFLAAAVIGFIGAILVALLKPVHYDYY